MSRPSPVEAPPNPAASWRCADADEGGQGEEGEWGEEGGSPRLSILSSWIGAGSPRRTAVLLRASSLLRQAVAVQPNLLPPSALLGIALAGAW